VPLRVTRRGSVACVRRRGDVTLISFIKGPADANWAQDKNKVGLSRYRVIMLGTLVKWKANPSATTRIVDVKLRPFLEGGR
jgi:hypothetical protein